jgi:hypothetical protein
MRRFLFGLFLLVNVQFGHSQADGKTILGVADFTSEVDSRYSKAVTEKVVEIVTNSKRFNVVDRTSYDKIKKELEFQKSEAFLDSKNTVKQDVALAAQSLIIGHIIKMNVFAMKNSDGTINGYKSSTAFTLKINDVESGKTTEAETFQTEVSPMMLSPESAVAESLKSVEVKLLNYLYGKFPLKTNMLKVLTSKKEQASTVLISGGTAFGFNIGDVLEVEKIEMLEGKPFPSTIGQIKVSRLAGDDFSECEVVKGGKEIFSAFNSGLKLKCISYSK